MRASNGRVDPRRPSIESAAATSAARASRSASSSARARRAADGCVPLMRARPSFGPSATGERPAVRSASAPGRCTPSRFASPSPTSTREMWASGARSPLAPTEPREGTTGCTRAFSSAIRASSVLARTPEYPHASTFARSAIVARTARLESGSPTPAAWLRSRFNCRVLKASCGIRTSANEPKPVLMP
jgi:hypothetical protein